MTQPIRVMLADDHPLFRSGVALSLEETGRFRVVAKVGSADEAVAGVLELRPDLALIDLSMPGGGIAAVRDIAARAPETGIVVLTASEHDDDVLAALASGARGNVLKGVGSEALVEVLDTVARGESDVPPQLAVRILAAMRRPVTRTASDDPIARLTEREDEFLHLVAEGLSNKEVARRLDLQEKTVKHHMTSILAMLNVRNRTEAALALQGRGSGSQP